MADRAYLSNPLQLELFDEYRVLLNTHCAEIKKTIENDRLFLEKLENESKLSSRR